MVIVQSLWIGNRLTTLEQLAIKSHLANGHEYHLYTYDSIENVPEGTTVKDGNEILPEDQIFTYQTEFGKGSYSAFSNYFRYELLFNKGGWWVDADVVCLRSFEELSHRIHLIAAERLEDGSPVCASCVLKAPPQSSLIGYCREKANAKDRSKIVWGEIGPGLVQEAMEQTNINCRAEPADFCPIDWFNIGCFFNSSQYPAIKESFAIHCWNELWRKYNFDKDGCYPPNSLYELLRRRYL